MLAGVRKLLFREIDIAQIWGTIRQSLSEALLSKNARPIRIDTEQSFPSKVSWREQDQEFVVDWSAPTTERTSQDIKKLALDRDVFLIVPASAVHSFEIHLPVSSAASASKIIGLNFSSMAPYQAEEVHFRATANAARTNAWFVDYVVKSQWQKCLDAAASAGLTVDAISLAGDLTNPIVLDRKTRARKLVRRNREGIALFSLVLLLGLASIALLTRIEKKTQRLEAETSRVLAELRRIKPSGNQTLKSLSLHNQIGTNPQSTAPFGAAASTLLQLLPRDGAIQHVIFEPSAISILTTDATAREIEAAAMKLGNTSARVDDGSDTRLKAVKIQPSAAAQ